MKKCILISVIFALVHLGVSGQQKTHTKSLLIDKAPLDVLSQTASPTANRDMWDLQFEFPIEDTTQGIETDGEFIYITNYLNSTFRKYDLQGNIIEYFTIPGVTRIRDLAYDGQYFYGGKATDSLFIMDFYSKTLIDVVPVTFPVRAIAYNSHENVFYSNNWDQSYIYEFTIDGDILDSIQCTEYGWTYGYAYDGWTEGGPYLWGLSQYANQTEAILTQYSLKTNEPTGFYKDLAYLAADPNYVFAGGLFTHQDLVSQTVTLGGLIQNDLVFGLELDSISCEAPLDLSFDIDLFDVILTWTPPVNQQFFLYGYNIYRNDTMINGIPITDTVYLDPDLPYGTHTYYVTALYHDDLGNPGCESNPSQSVDAFIEPPIISLGGNVIAGLDKMYFGHVNAYLYKNLEITEEYTSTIIDTLGYYFFLPFVNNDYFIHATPKPLSIYANDYAPTYFGNKLHWEEAPTVFLENSIYDANIDMIQMEQIETGSGIIQGMISHQNDMNQINPAEDILVLLMNDLTECVAYQHTDQDGNFQFNNLSIGLYNILVEVVGKDMNLAPFTLNNEITTIDNISFVITDGEILMGVEEPLPYYVNFVSDLFPNPTANQAHLEINLSKPTQISSSLYDARSKIISTNQTVLSTGSNKVSLGLESLPGGLYYFRISFKEGQSVIRKIVILN